MTIAIGRKGKADLQGGKPPKIIRSGRKVTITAAGVPPDVVEVNGHAKNGKPKKPRGAAGIPAIEGVNEVPPGPAAPTQPEAETRFIPLSRIDPSPTNPRQHFDESQLDELANSLRTDGLLQPILVRPKLHRYEIVAGERRFRAAKLAGFDQVECKVRRLDDWQALRVQWTENAEREDINEIEEAKHFQRMLDARAGLTQQQLADELGTSQGQVANRLRLLELPEAWQQKVISQEITATHARELVPFVKHETALEDLADDIQTNGTASVKQFRELIQEYVADHGIKLGGKEWDSVAADWVLWRVPVSPEERAAWGVVEIQDYRGKQLIAAPTDDARKAADYARQFRIDEARKRAEKRNKKAAAGKPGESPAAVAERKDEQFAKRLAAWKTDWLRVLCAERLEEKDNARLAGMFFLAMSLEYQVWQHHDQLEDVAECAGAMKLGHGSIYEMVRQAATCVELEDLHVQFARGLLIDLEDGQPRQWVDHDDVEDLAKELELPADLEAIWRKDQAGKLSEAYWSLHTKEQLEQLADELCIEFRGTSKAAMVDQLLETHELRLPVELGGKKPTAKKSPSKKGK
jgi:ParB family transcriptional regulator, chromosome partitioning protein